MGEGWRRDSLSGTSARTLVFTLRGEAVGVFKQRSGNKSIPAGLFGNQLFVK